MRLLLISQYFPVHIGGSEPQVYCLAKHLQPTVSWTKEPPVKVVWVANIKSLKKPETFVELAARLRTVTKAEFIMIGRPAGAKYQRRLEAQMRDVGGLT